MAHKLQLVQGAGTLVDFMDSTKFPTARWTPDWWTAKDWAQDALTLSVVGGSATAFNDNIIAFNRAVEAARENYDKWKAGEYYSPIFLQWQQSGGTMVLQSEVLGGKVSAPKIEPGHIDGNAVIGLSATLTRRPYFEETAAVVLVNAGTYNNNGTPIALSGLRGDMPAPLKIQVQAAAASNNRLIAALRAPAAGTVGNFVAKYTAEAYSDRGSGVANLADANLSPGGTVVTGQRWTPPNTTEQALIYWQFANPQDDYGAFRVLVRGRDNAGSVANVSLRARTWTWDTPTAAYTHGDFAESAGKTAGTVAGTTLTTQLPLIDCGVIRLPPRALGLAATSGSMSMGFSIWGKAASTATTFDIDEALLLPTDGGELAATFPVAMGSAGIPYGVIDSNDRVPYGYLSDAVGNSIHGPSNLAGQPPLGIPNRSMELFVITSIAATGLHDWNKNNVITVSYTPRYRLARGT